PGGSRPLRRPARRARVALGLSILLALASAVANLGDTRVAKDLAGDGASSGDLYLWVGLVQAAWFLVTAGYWLPWFRRAYRNLPALGARRLRYRPWWAVAAWLLPVVSLFRPQQVLNDIWRARDHDLPPPPPPAGPERPPAGPRPRPPPRPARRLAQAPGRRGPRLVVAGLPGLGPCPHHHHRGRRRPRTPSP